MRIGILGYKGRLGSQLVHMGCEPITAWLRNDMPEINFPTEDAVIINCAALTDVDRCETDKKYYEEAIRSNTLGVNYLASAYKGTIIHISTDYVFGGKHGAYKEDYWNEKDIPTKNSGYAITKMGGEVLAGLYDNIKIVRTTGLYGGVSQLNDFLKMFLEGYMFTDNDVLVTKELRGNQTYIPHLAEALIQYAEMCACGQQIPNILHIASKDVISRYEFALMIANVFGLDKSRIKPCKNSQVPGWVAERPKKGGLKVDLAIKLGLPIYTILEGLQEAKKEYENSRN